jgi:hypothetical protein
MDLNDVEIRFLHRFIGRTDIKLFAEEDFLTAISLHEKFSQKIQQIKNGRLHHDCD